MYVYVWKEIVNMSISWAPDMIGWACAQPFPTLATPLLSTLLTLSHLLISGTHDIEAVLKVSNSYCPTIFLVQILCGYYHA